MAILTEGLRRAEFLLSEGDDDIAKETVSVANRFGEECHVARYRLVSK